jgi:hypothetical protein
MRHPHTLRRALLATAMALAAVPLAASPAAALVKPIVFPVKGTVTYTDTFGACRDGCTRLHEGNDLMGKKMLPLVSAVDGVVYRITFDNASTGGNSVVIKASDGWTYHYLHVNNDTPGTDDGKATRSQAFPDNIVLGASVVRGQVVGYLGDSGNAEEAGSHLHFEIRQPPAPGSYTGVAIDPYDSLRAAQSATAVPARWYLRSTASSGPSSTSFAFGAGPGVRPLLCDWNGDGLAEPVHVVGGTWTLRTGVSTSTVARTFTFGTAQDTPSCGDVDGDGAQEPLLFRDGTWTARHDFETTSTIDWTSTYGVAGDRPVVGDWDGDGDDDFGVVRSSTWYLRSGAQSGATRTRFSWARATDVAVAADWDGDGIDTPGAFRDGTWFPKVTGVAGSETLPSFTYGTTGDVPLVAEWAPTDTTNIAVYRPGY